LIGVVQELVNEVSASLTMRIASGISLFIAANARSKSSGSRTPAETHRLGASLSRAITQCHAEVGCIPQHRNAA